MEHHYSKVFLYSIFDQFDMNKIRTIKRMHTMYGSLTRLLMIISKLQSKLDVVAESTIFKKPTPIME